MMRRPTSFPARASRLIGRAWAASALAQRLTAWLTPRFIRSHLTYPGLLHLLAALVLPDTDAPDPDSDAALIGLATYPTAVPAMLSEPLNLVAGSSVGSNAITAQVCAGVCGRVAAPVARV